MERISFISGESSGTNNDKYRRFDARGLYRPIYPAEQIRQLEGEPPLEDDSGMAVGQQKYDYLKPTEKVDELDQSLRTERLMVKETGNEAVGRGLYAQKKIAPGERIFEFDGRRWGEKKGELPSHYGLSAHGIVVGESRDGSQYSVYAIPDKHSPLRYLNHSCQPNAARVPGDPFGFVAIRPIEPGEEITADYSLLEANPYWKMENCGCGAVGCRHEIEGVFSLPLAYLQQNWARLTPGMQESAVRFSLDPEIVRVRDRLGAQVLAERQDLGMSYEDILGSNHPTLVRSRSLEGARRLTPIFLQALFSAPQFDNPFE